MQTEDLEKLRQQSMWCKSYALHISSSSSTR